MTQQVKNKNENCLQSVNVLKLSFHKVEQLHYTKADQISNYLSLLLLDICSNFLNRTLSFHGTLLIICGMSHVNIKLLPYIDHMLQKYPTKNEIHNIKHNSSKDVSCHCADKKGRGHMASVRQVLANSMQSCCGVYCGSI